MVTMISSVLVALKGEKIKNIYLWFFIIGGVGCFLDFLTVPIISLRFTTYSIFFSIAKDKKSRLERNIKNNNTFKFSMGSWILLDMGNKMGPCRFNIQ